MKESDSYNQILSLLEDKAKLKQRVFRTTLSVFDRFKNALEQLEEKLRKDFQPEDSRVEIVFTDNSEFEAQLKFGSDVLVVSMHSNVFTFEAEHEIHKLGYVKEDPRRQYCGVIHLHNFLADSLKYNRLHDVGYLIGRIFVNLEEHFFVDGQSQLGFLFNDFGVGSIRDDQITEILQLAVTYCMDFDLLTPPFATVRQISLQEKQFMEASSGYATGKRLGYKFRNELLPAIEASDS